MLDRPLTYQHYAGPEYQVEVGPLSRNLQFHTSDTTGCHSENPACQTVVSVLPTL